MEQQQRQPSIKSDAERRIFVAKKDPAKVSMIERVEDTPSSRRPVPSDVEKPAIFVRRANDMIGLLCRRPPIAVVVSEQSFVAVYSVVGTTLELLEYKSEIPRKKNDFISGTREAFR